MEGRQSLELWSERFITTEKPIINILFFSYSVIAALVVIVGLIVIVVARLPFDLKSLGIAGLLLAVWYVLFRLNLQETISTSVTIDGLEKSNGSATKRWGWSEIEGLAFKSAEKPLPIALGLEPFLNNRTHMNALEISLKGNNGKEIPFLQDMEGFLMALKSARKSYLVKTE